MTEPTNEISTTPVDIPVPVRVTAGALTEKMNYARALAASNLLPAHYRGKPENMLYAMEYAAMIGVPPMTAVTGIHVIEGKPSASSGLISGLVRRAGHRLRVWGDDVKATAEIVRKDDPTFTFRVEWTIDRAQKADLVRKGTWTKYPAAMLKARAITEVAREACEEALSGLHYTPEELGAETDEEGVPVEVSQVASARAQQQSRPEPRPAPQSTPAVTVDPIVVDAVVEKAFKHFKTRDDLLAFYTEQDAAVLASSAQSALVKFHMASDFLNLTSGTVADALKAAGTYLKANPGRTIDDAANDVTDAEEVAEEPWTEERLIMAGTEADIDEQALKDIAISKFEQDDLSKLTDEQRAQIARDYGFTEN